MCRVQEAPSEDREKLTDLEEHRKPGKKSTLLFVLSTWQPEKKNKHGPGGLLRWENHQWWIFHGCGGFSAHTVRLGPHCGLGDHVGFLRKDHSPILMDSHLAF